MMEIEQIIHLGVITPSRKSLEQLLRAHEDHLVKKVQDKHPPLNPAPLKKLLKLQEVSAPRSQGPHHLYLIEEKERKLYDWALYDDEQQEWLAFGIAHEQIGRACAKARRLLSPLSFRTLHCGQLYLLRPGQRDEIGTPALFSQMRLSYTQSSGRYHCKEFGSMAIVQHASEEALEHLEQLKKTQKAPSPL